MNQATQTTVTCPHCAGVLTLDHSDCQQDNSFACPLCKNIFTVTIPVAPQASNAAATECPLCGVIFENNQSADSFLHCPACHGKFKRNNAYQKSCRYCGSSLESGMEVCPTCRNKVKTIHFSIELEQEPPPYIDIMLAEAESESIISAETSHWFNWKAKLLLGAITTLLVIFIMGYYSINNTPRNLIKKSAQLCEKHQCAEAVAVGYDIFVRTRNGQKKANAPHEHLIPFWIASENGRNAMPEAMQDSLDLLIEQLCKQHIAPFSPRMSRKEACKKIARINTSELKRLIACLKPHDKYRKEFNFPRTHDKCSCFLEILKLTAQSFKQ